MPSGITERERALREERAQVFDVMRSVMEKFDLQGPLTVDDRKRYDDADAKLTTLDGDLDRLLKYRQAEEGKDLSAQGRGVTRDAADSASQRYKDAYVAWFKGGEMRLSDEQRNTLSGGEQRAGAALSTTTSAGVDGDAGFLIPQDFWDNLQIALKAYGGVLPLCNIVKTDTGAPMPWPTSDPTGQLGLYLTENTQLTGSDLIEFGQGMMHAWFISSDVIKASFAIMNDSAFDVEEFVVDRAGERIGRKVAAELHGGAGSASSALTGINTALTAYNKVNTTAGQPNAAPTGGYYQPANAETAFWLGHSGGSSASATLAAGIVSWGSLLGMISSVDPAYRQSGRSCFVMNDVTQYNIRQLTDAYGHPIWVPDLTVGPSNGPVARIEGFPVVIDQNTASVSTTGGTAGGPLFGDLKSAMVVRQVNQAGTMRLDERFADYLQVAWIAYVRMDALPNDLRALVQYESGAS